MPIINNKHFKAFVILLSLLILSIMLYFSWPFTVDDAFIAFRYSSHLAAGYGLTWNPGYAPVEGYTTFLWTVLMTIPHIIGFDPVIFSKIFGVLSTIIFIYISSLFVSRLTKDLFSKAIPIAELFVILLLSLFPVTSIHAISGMETAFFTMLLTLFLYLTYVCLNDFSLKNIIFLSLAGLLVGLTRPDGNLAVIVGLFALLVVLPKDKRRALIGVVSIFYLFPGAIYFIWRYTYYGHLFPLSFYLKVGSSSFLAGKYRVLTFIVYLATHIGVLIFFALKKLNKCLIPALFSVASLWLFFIFPRHLMGYLWRFLFPTVPFLFSIASLGVAVLWTEVRLRAKSGFSIAKIMLIFPILIPIFFLAEAYIAIKPKYEVGLKNQLYYSLGKKLNQFCSSDYSKILVSGDAGAIPYYSRWLVLDPVGLNDNYLSTGIDYEPYSVNDSLTTTKLNNYIFSHKPDLIILISTKRSVFVPKFPVMKVIFDKCIREGMVIIKRLEFFEDYNLFLLVHPQSSIARHLENWNYNENPCAKY